MRFKLIAITKLLQFFIILLLIPVYLDAQQKDSGSDPPVSNTEPSHAYYSLDEGKEIPLSGITEETGLETSYEFQFRNAWSEKQIFASLSGIDTPIQFFINGFHFGNGAGNQWGMEFNITPFLKPGTNRIVLVATTHSASDASCRQIKIISRDELHVRDVQVSRYSQTGSHETLLRIHLYIRSYLTRLNPGRTLILELSDPMGDIILHEEKDLSLSLAYGQEIEMFFDHTTPVLKPWSPSQPYLYELNLSLYTNGEDEPEHIRNSFGIGSIAYQDSLFIVNADTIVPKILYPGEIKGFCGLPENEILQLFKEGNYNALLISTTLPARLMNLFDRSGIIILIRKSHPNEIPDRVNINRPSVVWID